MFGFIDTSLETIVTIKHLPLEDLNVALYVLYYFEPHDPIEVIPKIDDTYDLVAGYYGANGKRIKREIEDCGGNLIKLYKG